MQRLVSGKRTRWASVGTVAALALTGVGVAPAQSATSTTDSPCPAPYPVSEIHQGDAVHGLTVDGANGTLGAAGGTTPDTFTGTVLGRLTNGIAPGVDMIMVQLTSSKIDEVGGIWEGMSGSPVYSADGRLIGAVAYGLSSGPSPIAGVTPAEEMEALLDGSSGGSAAPAARVALPNRIARTVLPHSAVPRSQDAPVFKQLRTPLGVDGLAGGNRLRLARKRLGMRRLHPMAIGAAGPNTDQTEVVPGGNVAASVSYGDVTVAGVGTVTAVCGTQVLAFGHPMNDTGPATLTLHGADALFIQPDPTAPFKVANITAPAGTVDQDRLAGLHGELGAAPKTAQITSYVESAGRSRTGTTWISVPDAVPDIATMHLLGDQDRVFDGVGKGSGTASWQIVGHRQDGSTFQLDRTDMYADQADVSSAIAFSLDDTLATLQHNRAEHISIDSVQTHSVLNRSYSHYKVGGVEVRWAGRWMPASRRSIIPARAGRMLRVRVLLTSPSLGARWVRVAVHVPRRAAGRIGSLDVFGGNATGFGGPVGLAALTGGPNLRTTSGFDSVLRRLRRAPHHNDVVATLTLVKARTPRIQRTGTSSVGHVVDGRGISVPVQGLR